MNRKHWLHSQPSELFSLFALLVIVAAIPLAIFLSKYWVAYPQQAAGNTPYLERLEVVTANAGSTDNSNGGNEWGYHKSRIVRTSDGNLYTVIQAPGTDDLHKEWQLFKRMGDNNWQKINSGVAGREPVNILAGPQNELYIIGWPDGHPKMWTSVDGGKTFTSQGIPGTWVTTDWPYSAASITPSGDIYLVQTVGGTGNCCSAPGYFYWAYYNRSTGQWCNTKVAQYDNRDTYAFLLPTDSGQLTIVGARTGEWANFGYTQPAASGGFNYVYNAVREWNTSNVDTTPLTANIIKEVSQNNGEYINAFQNDVYRDMSGRIHTLYTYRDASTGATADSTGTYTGYQAVADQNGTLVKNVPLTGIYFPNTARMIQDTTGSYWIITAGNNNTLEVAQADPTNGTSLNPYVTIPLAGYNAGGVTFIAAPRNGSTLQDFVDGVVPLNNGAGWLYYRLRLRSASTPTSTPTPSRVPSTSPTPIATSTSSPVPTASPAPTFTPTSTPTPTQQYYIYGDSLASGWVNKSHQSSINFANTSPVHAGTHSIAFTANAGWATLYVQSNRPFDTTPYTYLQFFAQATQPNQHYVISFVDASGKSLTPVLLANYGGDPIPGTWKEYTIPLSALGANAKKIKGVFIQNWTSNPHQLLYLDSIVLV